MPVLRERVQVREATASDTEPVLKLVCAAFGLDPDAARPLFYQDPYYDLSLKRVLTTSAHGLMSCLTIIPATLRIGGAYIPVAGIAGVATRPEHQRHGYASRLLTETNSTLAEGSEYSLSALFPYSEAYYRRLGWETASYSVRWHGWLPNACAELAIHVRPLSSDVEPDRLAIRRLHDHAAPSQTGLCRRDMRRWRILESMTPAWQWFVYERRGQITGYAACERIAGDEPILRIHEIVAADDEARHGLTAYLSRLEGPRTFAAWSAAPGQLALYGLDEAPEVLEQEPGMMLRVVNLLGALQCLSPAYAPVLAQSGRALTIFATDSHLPENERPVRLSAAGAAPDDVCEDEWLRADIRTLAQLYTGYCLPSQAAEQGELTVSSPEALALADTVFPLRKPYIAPGDQF